MYESIYQLYKDGFQPGVGIKIKQFDDAVTWETGRLAIVTGIPGHGKSEIVDFIVTRLNLIHGWKSAYFSPENHPIAYHYGKLAAKISGKSFEHKYMNEVEFKQVFDHMRQNFYFVSPEEDLSIDSILEKAKYLVRKHGIKILTIDPYNKMEHMMERGESETQYISRFLDKLTNFARINGVLVFLVAHPKKMQNRKDDSDLFEIPTLYDISGSANFYNKADYGLTVYRNWKENSVVVIIQKVKFKHWGAGGGVLFRYNHINGRIHLDADAPDYETYVGRQWIQPVQTAIVYAEPPDTEPEMGLIIERTVPF
jgi:twinkle protein